MAKGHFNNENKWVVAKGECLWRIASYSEVYGKGSRWTEIADANNIKRSKPTIYVNQKLKIPGITSPSSSSTKTDTNSDQVTGTKVRIEWWALDAPDDNLSYSDARQMFCVWKYDRANTDHYEIKEMYDTGQGGWRISETTSTLKQIEYSPDTSAKKVKIQIKPIAKQHEVKGKQEYYWKDGEWQTVEYDYSNNPPGALPSPAFNIDVNNKLSVEFTAIEDLSVVNADKIEIWIYQDDNFKYSTVTIPITEIHTDVGYAKYECIVEPGHRYRISYRSVRGEDNYGGWADMTENLLAKPIPPEKISSIRTEKLMDHGQPKYAALIEWPEEKSATSYVVQYSIDPNFVFDVNEYTTDEGSGPRATIQDLELGYTYYFRVGSINSQGRSDTYTESEELSLGTKPSAPTTYSNTTKGLLGEDIKLYWVHNSTDGSYESMARLQLIITDLAHPELQPMIIIKTIPNERPEEEKDKPGVYIINTDDPEWASVGDGFSIKWKVQTSGVSSEYSDWSIEREVTVYVKPSLSINLIDSEDQSAEDVHGFPFYISVLANPTSQIPISYYIEIVSNNTYETVDNIGKNKTVSQGDKIYQKYYDPQDNPWRFLLEMTPGNIDLEPNKEYTLNVTVAMDSGLSATESLIFNAYFEDFYYDVYADIVINKETLEAAIHPYCYKYDIVDEYYNLLDEEPVTWASDYIYYFIKNGNEYIQIDTEMYPIAPEWTENTFYELISVKDKSLVENCSLIVYRHEYDGEFTEIARDIANIDGLYVTDPHPALDYARYRIVAKLDDTGSISYGDVAPVKVKEPYLVIQWAEKWDQFMTDDDGSGMVETPWSGSMVKLPYNVDLSENRNIDLNLVEYIGRKRPVSYYGTQLREGATLNTAIPKYDKETLYAIRRLSVWTGDVYMREPSGVGYWAAISVSYDMKHDDLTIPISITVRRVEGGI